MPDLFRVLTLIPRFVESFTHGDGYRWSLQYQEGSNRPQYVEQQTKDANGRNRTRGMRESDWQQHFLGEPVKVKGRNSRLGSMAIACKFEGDWTRFFCLDCDNSRAVAEVRLKLLPVLDRMGVDYLWEESGSEEEERCHLWIMVDCRLSLLKALVDQIFEDAAVNPRDRAFQFELYPCIRENNLIRVPGGYHLKNNKVNAVQFKGRRSNDPADIMEMFLEASRLTEELVKLHLRPKKARVVDRTKRTVRGSGHFYYTPRNLPLPEGEQWPPVLKKVGSNCQAVNTLLWWTVGRKFLDDKGGMTHMWGLFLWNLALYNDLLRGGAHAPQGEEWVEPFYDKYRGRSWESHNWNYKKSQVDNQERLFPSCKTWDREFGLCDGCPFKENNLVKNPKSLFYGIQIERESVRPLKLMDAATIRRTTFPAIKARVKSLVRNASVLGGGANRKTLLLASSQGSGKSVLSDEIAVELAREGKNVLISVPTGKLALEHKQRIEALGEKAFVLMSHKNTFTLNPPTFGGCPYFDEIQEYTEYGISSRTYKKKFCDRCPFLEKCPFPNQYVNAQEPEYRIVIIQHAHFTAEEAMKNLLQKEFDVLFVDEAVVDSLLVTLKPTEVEWTLLEQLDVSWAPKLASWLRDGGTPQGVIHQTLEQMKVASELFEKHSAPFFLNEYIRYFNLGHTFDTTVGLHVFHPLPTHKIPVRVITDATPPKEMYQIILDDPYIEVYGEDEILDYRRLNPDNRVVQVLNTSMSKTSMRGPRNAEGGYDYERLVELLEFIGDKARGEFKDKRILVTTYKAFRSVAEEWLAANYPDVLERIQISHMKVGTNEFQDCDVQFLLAGVYLSAKQFHDSVYKLKTIANYWNLRKQRPLIPNFYHYGVGDDASIDRGLETVYRIMPVSGHAYVFKYPQFFYRPPQESYYNVVEKFMISKTQQALRLRYNNSNERVTYVFGNYFLPSFLVTHSVLEEELLGYLRYNPEDQSE